MKGLTRFMKGIELSFSFYNQYKDFLVPEEYRLNVSAGLVGNGSECFGFDDDISKDHDFDAGFCLWLDDDLPSSVYDLISERYASLPKEFLGVRRKANSNSKEKRKGVFYSSEFYKSLIGFTTAPKSPVEWLKIPDYALSSATNGRVFTDNATDFTYVRNKLINGVPNDVILKRLSRALILMAQAGQYNYIRCIKHGEEAAARLALNEFVLNAAYCTYYLNGKFPPYYKWLLRGMVDFKLGERISGLLSSLLLDTFYPECVDNIEKVSSMILSELKARELTLGDELYLEPHAFRVAGRIKDEKIAKMHIME